MWLVQTPRDPFNLLPQDRAYFDFPSLNKQKNSIYSEK